VLTVSGDNLDNTITTSRNAAGNLLVNGGAVAVVGGTPTVANTALIQVFGLGGNDLIALDETNGALPTANLFGGAGHDLLIGGSGGDLLFGQSGDDTLLGKGGFDFLFGGDDNDVLVGGDGDDQMFGEAGNDRMIWNPGDDTDLFEGGAGTDTVEVNGGNGAEIFTATANGTRVRFDRVTPAPFAIDIGTSEKLNLNANGGEDQFSATGNLAALIAITVDGGTGNDTVLGSNGNDLLLGGDGNDFLDGQQGSDTAQLGAGDDVFQWDPGDGSDVVEGQDGTNDTMLFNGANIAENFVASANGQRLRFTRNIGNITMDVDDVESLTVKALGGADNITVDELSATDLVNVNTDLFAAGNADDAQADNVIVNGTNGDDVVIVSGSANDATVQGLHTQVTLAGAFSALDRITVNALDGDDVVEASLLGVTPAQLTANGGNGDDVLIGGEGNDALNGEAGDDVLIGGPGIDILDGGPDDNVVIQLVAEEPVSSATIADEQWIEDHVQVVDGTTVIDVDGKQQALPETDLSQLVADEAPAA
jgi:Ca2+-binding RTX toxin-like protein